MWHELLPTKEMIKQAERSGKPLPPSLGAIRLRTWIKRGERTSHENGGDEEPDIEMKAKEKDVNNSSNRRDSLKKSKDLKKKKK
jgi:hypothetical protein